MQHKQGIARNQLQVSSLEDSISQVIDFESGHGLQIRAIGEEGKSLAFMKTIFLDFKNSFVSHQNFGILNVN